jgi:hypothetical protein
VSVIEKIILPFEKKLPTTSMRQVVITRDVVMDPERALAKMLENPDDPERLRKYREILSEEKQQIRDQVLRRKKRYVESYPLVFTPERIDLVLEHHIRTGTPIDAIFDEVILLYNQVRVFEDDFHERHGYKVHFDEEAVNAIVEEALQRDTTATVICNEVSRDYDYGFKLVAERSGQTQFVLPKKAVVHPDLFLDELIRDQYRRYPYSPSEAGKET